MTTADFADALRAYAVAFRRYHGLSPSVAEDVRGISFSELRSALLWAEGIARIFFAEDLSRDSFFCQVSEEDGVLVRWVSRRHDKDSGITFDVLRNRVIGCDSTSIGLDAPALAQLGVLRHVG